MKVSVEEGHITVCLAMDKEKKFGWKCKVVVLGYRTYQSHYIFVPVDAEFESNSYKKERFL